MQVMSLLLQGLPVVAIILVAGGNQNWLLLMILKYWQVVQQLVISHQGLLRFLLILMSGIFSFIF